jgi:hypothetical protein
MEYVMPHLLLERGGKIRDYRDRVTHLLRDLISGRGEGSRCDAMAAPKPSPGRHFAPAPASSFTAAATLSGPSPLTPLTTAGTIVGTIQ